MNLKQSQNAANSAAQRADSTRRLPDRAGPECGGRRVHSAELFANAQELEIEHNGAVYRLRKTSLGKLILTK